MTAFGDPPPLTQYQDNVDLTSAPLSSSLAASATLDLNRDELPDLFLAYKGQAQGAIAVHPGLKGGTWKLQPLTIPAPALAVAVADMNNDFVTDLIVATDAFLVVYTNNNGKLEEMTRLDAASASAGASVSIELADLDGNGLTDIFYSSGPDRPQAAFRNRLWFQQESDEGGAIFKTRQGADTAEKNCCRDIRLMDINGDSFLDQVSLHRDSVGMAINDGQGVFKAAAGWRLPEGQWRDLLPVDYNSDGRLDIVINQTGPEAGAWVFEQQAQGGFQGHRLPIANPAGPYRLLEWLDLDNNGLLDAVVEPAQSTMTYDYLLAERAPGGGLVYAYRRGDGESAGRLLFADFDRDGHMDRIAFRDDRAFLSHNTTQNYNWTGIKLKGQKNRSIAGTAVSVRTKDGKAAIRHFLHYSGGPVTVEQQELNIGLARSASITILEVFWPRSRYTRIDEPFVNRYIGFVEPDASHGGKNISLQHTIMDFARNAAKKRNKNRY